MKFKKLIGLLTSIAITMSSVTTFAAFWDVSSDASYSSALDRVSALGIINGTGDGAFNPDDSVTREQFAAMIVKAAGLGAKASNLTGSSVFVDVDPYGWSSGYINKAVDKGYLTVSTDYRFNPQNSISYAEACTILVKALGYGDSDISGTWPKGYIEKAKTLGISSGINIGTSTSLPRWAAAVMINNLLDIDMKSGSKTFAESTGTYVDAFIYANSQTDSKLLYNQIQTDKGIYYIPDGMQLELGGKYRFVVDDDKITHAYNTNANVLKISVDSIVDNKVTYTDNGTSKSLTLPDKTEYYYKGAKQTYDNLKSTIQAKSSIIMIYNQDNTGFDDALVFDPVMSKPYIVQGVGADAKIPDEYNPGSKAFIAKGTDGDDSIDGKVLTIDDLKLYDVLYKVTDIWGENQHILLVRNKVDGEISEILPDKLSPKSIKMDSKEYTLSDSFNANKINSTSGSFKLTDRVTLVLGNDGKVVDIYNKELGDNSKYAMVLDASYTVSDSVGSTGKIIYKVTLLHTDGTTDTYTVDKSAADLKGKLVTYSKWDDYRVEVEEVDNDDYTYLDGLNENDHYFAVDERTLDDIYIAENVKIFNIISNETGSAAKVDLIDLDQIPRGHVLPNKIKFYSKAGAFGDINLIVTNDLFDENYKVATVKALTSGNVNKTYTFLINGVEYKYTGTAVSTAIVGSVFKVKMENNKVTGIEQVMDADAEGYKVQAVDSKRIEIDNKIYWFSSNASVYLRDNDGNVTTIGTDEINTALTYARVAIYYNRSPYYGGKIVAVVITE